MSTIEAIDRLLASDVGADAWSDHVIDDVQHHLSKLTYDEWQLLKELWRKRPEKWQLRLADSLADNSLSLVAEDIFRQMLESGSDLLVLAAVESVYAYCGNGRKLAISNQAAKRIAEVAAKSSAFDKQTIAYALECLEIQP